VTKSPLLFITSSMQHSIPLLLLHFQMHLQPLLSLPVPSSSISMPMLMCPFDLSRYCISSSSHSIITSSNPIQSQRRCEASGTDVNSIAVATATPSLLLTFLSYIELKWGQTPLHRYLSRSNPVHYSCHLFPSRLSLSP